MFAPKEVGEVSDDEMWTVPEMAQGMLYQSYNSIPSRPDTYNSNFLDVATDNAVTNSFDTGIYRLAMGQYTSQSCPISVWTTAYEQFQNINLFLEKGLTPITHFATDETEDAKIKEQLKAEAIPQGMVGSIPAQTSWRSHGGRGCARLCNTHQVHRAGKCSRLLMDKERHV